MEDQGDLETLILGDIESQIFFSAPKFFEPNILFGPKFFSELQFFFGPQFFFRPKFLFTNFFCQKIYNEENQSGKINFISQFAKSKRFSSLAQLSPSLVFLQTCKKLKQQYNHWWPDPPPSPQHAYMIHKYFLKLRLKVNMNQTIRVSLYQRRQRPQFLSQNLMNTENCHELRVLGHVLFCFMDCISTSFLYFNNANILEKIIIHC